MTDNFMLDLPVICPYNSSHLIAESRFQAHVIKCSKNYPPNYRLCCPFNATHRFPKSLMDNHLSFCPDKKMVDRQIEELKRSTVLKSEMEDRSEIVCDESWEDKEGTLYEFSSIGDHDDSCVPVHITDKTRYEIPPVKPQFVRPQPTDLSAGRPPLGRAAVQMMDESVEAIADDEMEPGCSFVSVGRGEPEINESTESLLEKIRRRGVPRRNC